MQKGIGIRLTSLGLAALMTVSSPFVVKAHAEDYDSNNTYSYDISYVKDESGIVFEDQYTEALMNQYRIASDSQVVEIPEEFEYDVRRAIKDISDDEEITVGHLRKITRLFISSSYDDTDVSWLNYCTNLEDLFISGEVCNNLGDVIGLDHLKTVSLSIAFDEELQLDRCAFLKHSPEIDKLCIYGQCDPEYLYQLVNIKSMDLPVYLNHNVDFSRLSFLNNLTLNGGAYDIAIHLSNDVIAYLEGNGVNIIMGDFDKTTMEDVKRINERLDEIVKSLNLDPNATDKEKIDAVLIYCLEHLEYDEEVSNLLDNGRESEINHNYFYQDGYLYGALELDTQICGNYAAFIEALLRRVGVNSFMLVSQNHAWNLVEVEGEYYFYDSAWLDGQTINVSREEINEDPNGYTIEVTSEVKRADDILLSSDSEDDDLLVWYKVNPSDFFANPDKYYEVDGAHSAINFPINIVEVKTKKPSDQVSLLPSNPDSVVDEQGSDIINETDSETEDNNQFIYNKTYNQEESKFRHRLFDVTIGNKKFRITGLVLIGLMIALGGAFNARRLKQKKKSKSTKYYYDDYDGLYFADDPLESGEHKKL